MEAFGDPDVGINAGIGFGHVVFENLSFYAPGPHETFGLSALEALASGTPVVVSASSALPEIVGGSGAAALDRPEAFAAGVTTLLAADEGVRRAAARARAEQFGWPASVAGMLGRLSSGTA